MEELAAKENRTPVEELMFQTGLALQACGRFEDWAFYKEDSQNSLGREIAMKFWQDVLERATVAARVANFSPDEKAAYEKRVTALRAETKAAMCAANLYSSFWDNLCQQEEYELDRERFWKERLPEFQRHAVPVQLKKLLRELL